MLTNLNHPDVVRVMGIDHSTSNMGVWFADVPITEVKKFQLVYGNTINGEKVLFDIPLQYDDTRGTGVLAKMFCMARAAGQLADIYHPDVVIVEDTWLGMSALTFKQLVQASGFLRDVFLNRGVHLSFVLPNLAKAIVGVTGKATSDKTAVWEGVQTYPWLDSNGLDLSVMDEHTIDAGAVTLFRCETIAVDYGVSRHEHLNTTFGNPS